MAEEIRAYALGIYRFKIRVESSIQTQHPIQSHVNGASSAAHVIRNASSIEQTKVNIKSIFSAISVFHSIHAGIFN